MTGEKLDYLIYLLNSKIFFYSIKKFYGGGTLGQKGVRMKHTFFTKFPALKIELYEFNKFINGFNCATNKDQYVDNYFYSKYNLNEEEIYFIETEEK